MCVCVCSADCFLFFFGIILYVNCFGYALHVYRISYSG